MKKINLFFIILIISACTPQVTVTSEVTVTLTPPPQIENTQIIPTPTETEMTIEETAQALFAGQLTEAQIAALTPDQRYKIYQLAANWVVVDSKEINPNVLNESMRKELSIAVTDKRNELRGENPAIYIEIHLPRAIDNEEYTHVFYEGTWIKIEGSQNIKSNDDIKNGDFNWPDTEIVDPQWVPEEGKDLLGLTIPEYIYLTSKGGMTTAQLFCLNKEVGEINIPGFGSSGTLLCYVINENNPFSVRAITITGAPSLYGDTLRADSSYTIAEGTNFVQKMEVGTLYYLMYKIDQKNEFATSYPGSNGQEVTANYAEFSPSHQSHSIINGELDSEKLVLIQATLLMEEGK